MPAKADARERRVGKHVRENGIIGWPVLEAPRNIPDHLIGNTSRRHPGGDHLLIFVCLRLLGTRICGEDKIRSLAARFQLDEESGGIDPDAIGENDRWWRGD